MTARRARSAAQCAALCLLGIGAACAKTSPPLIEVPGATIVATAADGGSLLAIAELFRSAGVLASSPDVDAAFAHMKTALPGRPLVASVLENGALLVATRAPTGSSLLVEPGEIVLGKVRRADALTAGALVRIDGDRALIGLPGSSDPTSLAGLMEALASADPPAAAPALVPDGAVHVRMRSLGALRIDPTLHLVARAVERELRIDEAEPAPLRAALSAPAPSWTCAFEDAALLLSIPPIAGVTPSTAGDAGADSFSGRVVVALYPPADGERPEPNDPLSYLSLVVTGVPRDDAAGADLFESAFKAAGPKATVTRVGARADLEVAGGRPLRVVSSPGLFAMGFGGGAPLERATIDAPCAGRDTPLVLASGPRLAQIVLPALMTPEVVLKALGGASVDEALPLARLRGIRTLRVDAAGGIRARVAFDVPK